MLASAGELQALHHCLAALLPSCRDRGFEVVVVRDCSSAELRELAGTYADVLFMPAPDGSTARQLRSIGFSATDGDIVAIIEDSALVDAEWVAQLRPDR